MKTMYQLWMISGNVQTLLDTSQNEFDLIQKLNSMESAIIAIHRDELAIATMERELKKKIPTVELVDMLDKFGDDTKLFRFHFGTDYAAYELQNSTFEIKKVYKLEVI